MLESQFESMSMASGTIRNFACAALVEDYYQFGQPLSPQGFYQLVAEEICRHGTIDETGLKVLQVFSWVLRLDSGASQQIARRAYSKYKSGILGQKRSFTPERLYRRILQHIIDRGRITDREGKMLIAMRKVFGISRYAHDAAVRTVKDEFNLARRQVLLPGSLPRAGRKTVSQRLLSSLKNAIEAASFRRTGKSRASEACVAVATEATRSAADHGMSDLELSSPEAQDALFPATPPSIPVQDHEDLFSSLAQSDESDGTSNRIESHEEHLQAPSDEDGEISGLEVPPPLAAPGEILGYLSPIVDRTVVSDEAERRAALSALMHEVAVGSKKRAQERHSSRNSGATSGPSLKLDLGEINLKMWAGLTTGILFGGLCLINAVTGWGLLTGVIKNPVFFAIAGVVYAYQALMENAHEAA